MTAQREPQPASWVNARIEIVIPLDVKITDNEWAKQEAVGRQIDRLLDALPEELGQHVLSGAWEDFHVDA